MTLRDKLKIAERALENTFGALGLQHKLFCGAIPMNPNFPTAKSQRAIIEALAKIRGKEDRR